MNPATIRRKPENDLNTILKLSGSKMCIFPSALQNLLNFLQILLIKHKLAGFNHIFRSDLKTYFKMHLKQKKISTAVPIDASH